MFRNTFPTKLYWILFPIEDLRQAVEIAKRTLTNKKLVKQLSRQSSSTPFISIGDSHNRKVLFDTKEKLGDKIDKLAVMIAKLATRESGTRRQFNHKFTKVEAEDKIEVTMTDAIMISKDTRRDIGQIVETEDRTEVGLYMKKNYRTDNFRGNVRNFDKQNSRGEYRNNYRNEGYDRSRNRSGERSFSRCYNNNSNRSKSNSRSRSGMRASMNRDRIKCYKCREYDHFT